MQGNPEDLKGRGYVETSHPDASAAGHRTFVNPSTGDKFATTKEYLEPLAVREKITTIATIPIRQAKVRISRNG
jgi:hypothetical protein